MTRFNIRNFSRRLKRELSLTPLLAGFLAACGNASTTSDFFISPTPPTDGDGNTGDFDILVTDGPIWGATVYVDENDDEQYNVGEEELGVTDEHGILTVDGVLSWNNPPTAGQLSADLDNVFEVIATVNDDEGLQDLIYLSITLV